MRVPNLGETDLLVPLHEGVFEQPMWQTFLARLRVATGAIGASLLLQSPGERAVLRLASGDMPFDPECMEGWAAMRTGRVYSGAELVRDGKGPSILAMRLDLPERIDARLCIAADAPLGPDVANLMVALQPHLRAAMRVLADRERSRARSEMTAGAFARMNFGWITLDPRCRIVDCDAQAGRVLQQSGVLRRGHYDRLTPAAPQVDRQMTELVRTFAADPKARPRAINLSHDPWIDILVAPVRLGVLAGGTDAVAAVYLRGDRSSSADRCEQLGDLFDLTPSEARLAWSIAQGLSIAEAAQEHGLTIETARNYSKKIYAKTGARGQVDLVRNILTGVLALA